MCTYNICLYTKWVFHHKLLLNISQLILFIQRNEHVEINNFSCCLSCTYFLLLTAYLEMFHGSILLNCELPGCKKPAPVNLGTRWWGQSGDHHKYTRNAHCRQSSSAINSTHRWKLMTRTFVWSNGVARTLKTLRTSKGDYCIKQCFSTITSLFKMGTALKGKNCSQSERILSFNSSSLRYGNHFYHIRWAPLSVTIFIMHMRILRNGWRFMMVVHLFQKKSTVYQ